MVVSAVSKNERCAAGSQPTGWLLRTDSISRAQDPYTRLSLNATKPPK
jgi:hypothetical protein